MTEHIWASWLRDDRLQFRPPIRSDAASGAHWHEGDPPPLAHRIEAALEASETIPWGNADTVRLIIGDIETGETLGGVVVRRGWQSVEDIVITPSRALSQDGRADIERRAMSLLTGWLLDDVGARSIVFRTDATRATLIESAAALGYELAYTLREFAFVGGRFVDVCAYQLLNPRWSLTLAEGA